MEIVYHCVAGRVADSPLAVHRALLEREEARGPRSTHTWLVDPARAADVPPGSLTAPTDGPLAIDALQRADAVISTTHLDPAWRKRRGALYVQAWHGTPLKRIAGDELGAVRDPTTGLSLVPGADDVARWDVLLSPNAASTSRLRSAFRYDGEVAQTGLPRNDVLVGPGAGERRDRVRSRLGIEEGTTAVLWTPTWREGGSSVDVDGFCGGFAARFGDDHVLLLRLHPSVGSRPPGGATASRSPQARVLDVSAEAEASDLYLAADALVGDYSSTIVDFAVTRRPIVLHTPDLERYAYSERGLYVDLSVEGPGPVLTDRADVIDALADLPALGTAWRERYDAFRDRYCHLDDGHASQRVLAILDRARTGPQHARDTTTSSLPHTAAAHVGDAGPRLVPTRLADNGPTGLAVPGGTLSAVILAAGLGSRLGRSLPKPLTVLPDGRSILASQVQHLRATFGADLAITAVVGHKASVVMAAAPDLLFAYNPRYASTNTAVSLRRALVTSRPGPVLWCNGDVVFDPALLAELAPALTGGRTAVCVDTSAVADEEVKYTVDGRGLVAQLSKTVLGGLGEAVGINLIAAADRPLLLEHLAACADQDYFERGIETAIGDGLEVTPVDISAYAAVEVDVEEDLVRAGVRVYGQDPIG